MGVSHKNTTHTTMKTAFLRSRTPARVPPRRGSGRAALRETAPTTPRSRVDVAVEIHRYHLRRI